MSPTANGAQLYFAYGSNLSRTQMADRCPSAVFVARALLPDHVLTFPRWSARRKCGVGGIAARTGGKVWGVVYRIAARDIVSLDASEGYDSNHPPHENNYIRAAVEIMREGRPDDLLTVLTYFAVAMPGKHIPSADYRDTIIRGAREHDLPSDYIAGLEVIQIL